MDKVVGKVLSKTVGRVLRPVLGFLNRRVLGKLPEEAITGSLQEEKPLGEDADDIKKVISTQLEAEGSLIIGKSDEELISEVMTDSASSSGSEKSDEKVVS